MNNHLNILLIEDEPGDALIIQRLLDEIKGLDYALTQCARLDRGLAVLDEQNFDIILLDLNLQESRGLQTFKELNSAIAGVPVVILTGMDDETLGIKAINKGAQDYLVKDLVDSRLLRKTLFYAIERKKTEEALQSAHAELEQKVQDRTERLEEKSVTLKEVLNHIREAKKETRKEYRDFIEQVILPIIAKLRKNVDQENEVLLKVLEDELKDLITQGLDYLDLFVKLTPREIEICNLIKSGLISKEIGHELYISPATVNKHRKNIRGKLGIKAKPVNLRSFLLREK